MKTSIIAVCLCACVAVVFSQYGGQPGGMPGGPDPMPYDGMPGGMPGGPSPPGGLQTISHAEARPIANWAVRELGSEYRLLAITRKQSQVVQGMLYHLTLLVSKRAPFMGYSVESCDVQVHVIPWMSSQELIHRQCTPRSMPRQSGY